MVTILVDEAHLNQLNLFSFKSFEEMLIKHDFIPYRLIEKPISSEQIRDDDILFIGVPGEHFLEEEIETIQRFVERDKKILILVYGTSSESSSNMGLIVQKYGIDFNHDLVHDKKNNKMGEYIPIIKNFSNHFITKGMKKLNYSGSSLSIFDESIVPLAFSSETAIPPNQPVMALGCNGQLIVIGGSSIFSDANFGLSAEDNKRCAENIINYCQKLILGSISSISKDQQKDLEKIRKKEEKMQKEMEKMEQKNKKKLKIKDIIKDLSKIISDKVQKLKLIERDTDGYWTKNSELITTASIIQQLEKLEIEMKSGYHDLRDKIETVRDEAFKKYNEAHDSYLDPEEFQMTTQEIINSIYIAESEVSTKLDMVRNNLIQLLNNKRAEISKN
ncbi:MAG: hypothetical protein EAX96_12150 [Candidatus Lokiarchaeota archaeon]|nr:hypothetical protein [Candidatus Lokiarchaeota archaeon]